MCLKHRKSRTWFPQCAECCHTDTPEYQKGTVLLHQDIDLVRIVVPHPPHHSLVVLCQAPTAFFRDFNSRAALLGATGWTGVLPLS